MTIAFFALAIVVAGVVMATLRIGSGATSQVRDRIVGALEKVRLYRMLDKRHVDIPRFVDETDPAVIRQEIRNCEACQAIDRCDTALDNPADDDVSFCPNADAIDRSAPHVKTPVRAATDLERQPPAGRRDL